MNRRYAVLGIAILGLVLGTLIASRAQEEKKPEGQQPVMHLKPVPTDYEAGSLRRFKPQKVNINIKPIASDPSIKYDYDIVFVRSPRRGDDQQTSWPEVFSPVKVEAGADLMLLHPDGSEEVLVKAGPRQSVTDLFVSFDAQWVYYALFDGIERKPSGDDYAQSSDIYKLNVKTRQVVQLTHQEYTPNTGVVAEGYKPSGVFNLGPCPLPGGGVMFTSDRNGFVATKSYKGFAFHRDEYTTAHDFQLFRMENDGSNVETVGYLNINSALHPVIVKDGRVMFTSFETDGFHDVREWAVWTINPDGTHWAPLFSALGASSENARHFSTQLSDGHIIIEEYYFQHNMGFGTYYKLPGGAPQGEASFGPGYRKDERNIANPKLGAIAGRSPFSPLGAVELTRFSHSLNEQAYPSDPDDPKSPGDGKFTHPAGAPDNNLLTVYSPGPVYGFAPNDRHHEFVAPAIHSGIYMIKGGKEIDQPSQLLLIKNDPNYNLQWPRALVTYKRIYGVNEPAKLTSTSYDENLAKELPEGSPYGIIGSASLYKRETYPGGTVPSGKVTAQYEGGDDPFLNLGGLGSFSSANWVVQGADDGKYDNSDIHAIRILIEEPTTSPDSIPEKARKWLNATNERLRILGEFPVRKFNDGKQPVDPDGNPDTSFMVKLPANVAWTFQTLDKNGMVLNMAQTWHQVRPGEVRTDCGGCHAHSQKPTPWEKTAAAKPDYTVFDLTQHTSLITTKKYDESHKKWDANDETGLRFQKGVKDVEYYRDIKPILDRSCVACHTQKWEKPAGDLILDDDEIKPRDFFRGVEQGRGNKIEVPGTYVRLAMDLQGKFGHPSPLGFWGQGQASRYIREFQSRRSLLAWKIFGKRLDGFSNDDFAYETKPGDHTSLQYRGTPVAMIKPTDPKDTIPAVNIGYVGTIMPPPASVAGTYKARNGQIIKVPDLSDEDRLTIVRWIDLGCPIDLDYDPANPKARGRGWLADDDRPTLTLTDPIADANNKLTHIVVGMYDAESGLDMNSFKVVADFALDGIPAGQNLASKFKTKSPGVWELTLSHPMAKLAKGNLTVSVKDNQGNVSEIVRKFSVKPGALANRSARVRNEPQVVGGN